MDRSTHTRAQAASSAWNRAGKAYLECATSNQLPARVSLRELAPIAIIAPHPDDETLGCGGLIATCSDAGIPLVVITLTDGEASHPNSTDITPTALAAIRRVEQASALAVLTGGESLVSVRTGWPDGRLERDLAHRRCGWSFRLWRLFAQHRVKSVFVASGADDHGDHRAAYQLALSAACAPIRRLFTYSIWPRGDQPRNATIWRFACEDVLDRKRNAVACYASQLGQVISDDATGFRMPSALLRRALTPTEVFTELRCRPS